MEVDVVVVLGRIGSYSWTGGGEYGVEVSIPGDWLLFLIVFIQILEISYKMLYQFVKFLGNVTTIRIIPVINAIIKLIYI